MVKFPQFASFRSEEFDICELNFHSEKMTKLKDLLLEIIEDNDENDQKTNIFDQIKGSEFSSEVTEMKNMLASMSNGDLESAQIKFRILLLKDLLSQVEVQYQESLSAVDEISTHISSITDSKINEIYNYKNSLQSTIIALEKQII